VTPCSLVDVYQLFGKICYGHHHGSPVQDLLHLTWRQCVPVKCGYVSIKVHDVSYQEKIILRFAKSKKAEDKIVQ
jgi:hypothetical protein